MRHHPPKLASRPSVTTGGRSTALLDRTAELTDGYSGASLAALMNEAAILSVRADREQMTLADVEKVIERNLVGVSSAPMEDGWGKDHRAMVEAGRAVLWSSKQSMNYCSEVLRVTIKPYGQQMSGVMLMPERSDAGKTTHFTGEERADTLDDFIDGLAMLLAGRCVETVFFGPQGVSIQTKGDLVAAADVAYDIVTASGQYPDQAGGFAPFWPEELIEHFQIPKRDMEAGVYDLMVRAHIRAEEYVNYYKPVILQVASELLAHGSLYGSHVRDLVDDHEVRMKMAKDAELARSRRRKPRRKAEGRGPSQGRAEGRAPHGGLERRRVHDEGRAPDAAEDAAAQLPPAVGTPPQMFAADAKEAAAMDQADAKRAGSQAKEAGLKAKKAKKAKKKAEDAKAKEKKAAQDSGDPFGESGGGDEVGGGEGTGGDGRGGRGARGGPEAVAGRRLRR